VKHRASMVAALLVAAIPLVHAQAPDAGDGKGPARRFDCSQARDPKGCEERLAKVREAGDKARKACEGQSGAERRECMEKSFCADAKDPARCEAGLKARARQRQELREACKGKKGDELKTCLREHRGAKK